MSNPERYRSRAVYREENLYYDLGYRFSTTNGNKPLKGFNKDYTLALLGTSFAIQVLLDISQIFTILSILILIMMRYLSEDKSRSPVFIMFVIIAHVYDYMNEDVVANPGKIIQGKLTTAFWFFEIAWISILAYQFLIIFQPYTPLIAPGQSVKAETREASDLFNKMKKRSIGTEFELLPLKKLINIEKLQETLISISKLVILITAGSIIIDIIIWQIIYSFGGGDNIFEQYIISGMSLVLLSLLVFFSKYISPDDDME